MYKIHTARLRSNHKFYKSDIKPAINQTTRLQYKTHLVQTQEEKLH